MGDLGWLLVGGASVALHGRPWTGRQATLYFLLRMASHVYIGSLPFSQRDWALALISTNFSCIFSFLYSKNDFAKQHDGVQHGMMCHTW